MARVVIYQGNDLAMTLVVTPATPGGLRVALVDKYGQDIWGEMDVAQWGKLCRAVNAELSQMADEGTGMEAVLRRQAGLFTVAELQGFGAATSANNFNQKQENENAH